MVSIIVPMKPITRPIISSAEGHIIVRKAAITTLMIDYSCRSALIGPYGAFSVPKAAIVVAQPSSAIIHPTKPANQYCHLKVARLCALEKWMTCIIERIMLTTSQ